MANTEVRSDFSAISLEDFMSFELRAQAKIVKQMSPEKRKALEEEALEQVNFYGRALTQPGAQLASDSGYVSEVNSYTKWNRFLAVYTLLSGWFLEEDLKAREMKKNLEELKDFLNG